jgi:hypothetical protein
MELMGSIAGIQTEMALMTPLKILMVTVLGIV